MGIFTALAGPVIGGLSSLLGGERGNEASAQQAEVNRQFQYNMARTSHQLATKDLEAAGLNRILSATQGGAPMAAGSTAQQHDTITPAVSTALATKMQSEQIENLREQRRVIGAEADLKRIEADQAAYKNWDLVSTTSEDGNPVTVKRWIDQWENESRAAVAEAKTKQQTQETNVAIRKLEELLKKAEIPGAEAMADFWKSIGDYLPYLKLLASGAAGSVGVAAAAKKLLSKAPGMTRITNVYNNIKPWGGHSARSITGRKAVPMSDADYQKELRKGGFRE